MNRTLTASWLCAALASTVAAQTLSEDELLRRWGAQADIIRQQQSGAQGGDTRGVAIFDGRSEADVGDAEVRARAEPPDPERARPAAIQADDPPDFPEEIDVDLRVTFETNSAYIRPSAASLLRTLCQAIAEAPPSWRFNIIGHADAAGPSEHNRALSRARAQEVARHLQRECGVAGERLTVYGLGESRLLPDVDPVSEANRRVEVQIDRI